MASSRLVEMALPVARLAICIVSVCAFCCVARSAPPPPDLADAPAGTYGLHEAENDVIDMDLEQLAQADMVVPALDTVVSTVSRQESTVGRSPAAVFVITPEMIRRSGANNIPDLLRMVPGVQVARIDANKWAISIRGFNDRFASKLLVQIDGRSVYSQFFNGVLWDKQDVVLQDVERIEVIRGPGATVWGANAVNGVINIITKQAKDTQGLLISGGTGTEERGFSTVRYGGRVGNDLHWRVYGKQFERDGGYYPNEEFDDWRQGRGGFRADWTPNACNTITVQGDFYDGQSGSQNVGTLPVPPFAAITRFDNHVYGQDFLTRWTRVLDDESDWSLQCYYDREGLNSPDLDFEVSTLDVDFQYRFPVGTRHSLISGLGYRHIEDEFLGAFFFEMDPPMRKTDLYSYFIQDEVTLEEDRWYLTVGSKFEHNDFSGFEYQPSIRLLHLPSDRESVWAAVSRAVRTPSRADHDFVGHVLISPFGPVFGRLLGNPDFVAEELLAFEAGYRAQPSEDFSWDLALFYNDYENLLDTVAGAPFPDINPPGLYVPLVQTNRKDGHAYGAELAATYQVNPCWELSGYYSLLFLDTWGPNGEDEEGSSPRNQVYVHSAWDLAYDLEFDLIGRYVDSVIEKGASSYLTMDVRLAWRPNEHFEWAVVGRNFFDSHRTESIDTSAGAIGTEIQPEVFTVLTWIH